MDDRLPACVGEMNAKSRSRTIASEVRVIRTCQSLLATGPSQMPQPWSMNRFAHGVASENGGLHQTNPCQGWVSPSSCFVHTAAVGTREMPRGGLAGSRSNVSPSASKTHPGVYRSSVSRDWTGAENSRAGSFMWCHSSLFGSVGRRRSVPT
jgi:hypothetical protein